MTSNTSARMSEVLPDETEDMGDGTITSWYSLESAKRIYQLGVAAGSQRPVEVDELIRDMTREADFAWPPGEQLCFVGAREQRIATLLRRAIAALRPSD